MSNPPIREKLSTYFRPHWPICSPNRPKISVSGPTSKRSRAPRSPRIVFISEELYLVEGKLAPTRVVDLALGDSSGESPPQQSVANGPANFSTVVNTIHLSTIRDQSRENTDIHAASLLATTALEGQHESAALQIGSTFGSEFGRVRHWYRRN